MSKSEGYWRNRTSDLGKTCFGVGRTTDVEGVKDQIPSNHTTRLSNPRNYLPLELPQILKFSGNNPRKVQVIAKGHYEVDEGERWMKNTETEEKTEAEKTRDRG